MNLFLRRWITSLETLKMEESAKNSIYPNILSLALIAISKDLRLLSQMTHKELANTFKFDYN